METSNQGGGGGGDKYASLSGLFSDDLSLAPSSTAAPHPTSAAAAAAAGVNWNPVSWGSNTQPTSVSQGKLRLARVVSAAKNVWKSKDDIYMNTCNKTNNDNNLIIIKIS